MKRVYYSLPVVFFVLFYVTYYIGASMVLSGIMIGCAGLSAFSLGVYSNRENTSEGGGDNGE